MIFKIKTNIYNRITIVILLSISIFSIMMFIYNLKSILFLIIFSCSLFASIILATIIILFKERILISNNKIVLMKNIKHNEVELFSDDIIYGKNLFIEDRTFTTNDFLPLNKYFSNIYILCDENDKNIDIIYSLNKNDNFIILFSIDNKDELIHELKKNFKNITINDNMKINNIIYKQCN